MFQSNYLQASNNKVHNIDASLLGLIYEMKHFCAERPFVPKVKLSYSSPAMHFSGSGKTVGPLCVNVRVSWCDGN